MVKRIIDWPEPTGPTTKPSVNKCKIVAHCEARYQECKHNPNGSLPCPYWTPWRAIFVCTSDDAIAEAMERNDA